MATAFVVALFLFKNKDTFTNQNEKASEQEGLTYKNEVLENLVNKDTDLDGVLDWEESLWGTDPTKKETTPGIPDGNAIAKLKPKTEQGKSSKLPPGDTENLTETDKFSREFFATIATLNQNGAMDQETIEKLSSSLAEHIQNSPPRKVFVLADMKIKNDNSLQAIKNYDNTLNNIYKKYPVKENVMNVLQRFIVDQDNVDSSALLELDPIIEQTKKIIDAMVKMEVPQSFASLHLEFVNGLQNSTENLTDIKLYDSDVIVALSGISKYEKNIETLAIANNNLANTIRQKLNN
ncbi:hypothetical protein A2818_00175 [Candidatus Nomurabacteria bacterium RIFCSPHIGHO2_01_FULL_40_12]|uniref:Uncharacterized protein n=1 Tax=Candidatus Nomurabacteria bacterium RIFCSPHIGHO2_01_FULL_40_12 TaxID=1801737 RepID=A0A1F6V0X8_9BACT|nr:MAG: hypothetical protein A2818_00175 [Candidatus Nomurabacteria bacterium RIFCSPHIGHO2_01_FULL_40_12]